MLSLELSSVRYNRGMEFVGPRIKELRESRRLTQGQLAYLAKISRNHLWRIEKGERPKVGAEILARIAAALGVSVEDLLGEGQPAQIAQPPLDPDVAELAARLNSLPAARRAQAIDAISGVLDFGTAEDQEDEPSAFIRQLATYVDDLNEDDQQFVLEQIRDLKRRRASAAPRGGQPATG